MYAFVKAFLEARLNEDLTLKADITGSFSLLEKYWSCSWQKNIPNENNIEVNK